jgi:hypothetical protein
MTTLNFWDVMSCSPVERVVNVPAAPNLLPSVLVIEIAGAFETLPTFY